MITIRSEVRVRQTAGVTIGLIAINTAVFIYEMTLSPRGLNHLVLQWGIVPDQLNTASLFTSMFLHAGWLHLGGNMLYLWVFGRNVEDLIGGAKFLGFYLLCGLAAAVVHVIANIHSPAPTIGASGAIAGVMGAYLIKFPRARIFTLIFFFFVTTVEFPAWLLLLWWFAIQFFSGFGSLGSNNYGGGTAWFAHVGGFLAGMALIRLFPPKRRWRNWYVDEEY
ncbi:MAG: rhomboid family intramembrane serine protease [Bryobacteraceae bacterium]